MKEFPRKFRQLQLIFFCNSNSLFAGTRISACRTGCNHVQWISDDIGKNNCVYTGWQTYLRELSTLYGRKPFAQSINLNNISPTSKELLRNIC